MRNSHNITLTNNDSLTEDEETTWSLPGAVVGFISWLFALAMPMLIYGSNTLFFFIYTWPFFLALMPEDGWCVFDNTASGAATQNALTALRQMAPVSRQEGRFL